MRKITSSCSWKVRSKRAMKAAVAGLVAFGCCDMLHAQVPFPAVPNGNQPTVQQGRQSAAPKLQTYNVPSEFVGTLGAQLQINYRQNPSVSVTTAPKTGQLMVMAPEAIQRDIAAMLTKFMQENRPQVNDRGLSVASNRHQDYQLKNLSWRELEDALTRLGGPKLTINTERNGELAVLRIPNASGLQDVMQIDRRLNRVTILGTGPSVIGWGQVVHSLDQGQVERNVTTNIVPLAPAEPRRVRAAVQMIKAAVVQDQGGGNAEAQVNVDDEQVTAAGTLEDLDSSSGLFGDVQIEFIDDIGLVIIRGSKRDVQRTLQVIEDIKKRAAETQPEIELLPLQHANAQAVETLVTDLYATIYEPRQGPVSITALGQPNSLLLIGRKEVVQSVKELVQKIDQPLDPDNQLKVIRLLHASSVDVEARIREFFVENPGSNDELRAAIGTRVKVLADYRTNSLIVQAAPREMVEVERLVAQLDVESTTAQNDVKVFRLKNTLSDDLVTVIQEVIGAENVTGADTSQATPPSGKITIVTREGDRVDSGILAGVVITSNPSVNSIVVRAPAQSMDLIEKLINELDQLPSAEARIKVYPLQNADATSLAQLLQQLFGLPVTAGQTGAQSAFTNLTQSAITTGGESSLVQLQIAADARTNTVVASGAESDLEVMEALLFRLDEDVIEDRRTEVIWLRNANSDEVQAAVQSYVQQEFQSQQNLINGQQQLISPAQLVDRQVFVVSEPATNSILLSATPAYFDSVLSVIEKLDRRPPLVAIQVLIAEVQLDDQFELGAEWGIQDGLLFDRGTATGGTLSSGPFNVLGPLTNAVTTGQPQNVAGQALTSFALGRSNSDGIGGLVLSASSEAVGVLVRALQSANRLQILSRPQITTLDSRPASTLIGQQVPRIQGVTQAGVGIPQTVNTTDVPVGLSLEVLPRVNQDGLILMQVQVVNSSVGDPDTGIPVGFGQNGEVIRSPIINSTEASTTVTAYSGQTVVFAGLITKNRGSVRRQIPFLGSLPILGAAFRFDTEVERRTELMVVLTPRIIYTDEDYEMLKQVESSRMSWCLADVLNLHGDVGLNGGNGLWGPAKSSMIYPDLQPTVLDDRSRPGSMQPQIINEYPIGEIPMMAPADALQPNTVETAPSVDLGASKQKAGSPYQTVGYGQPVTGNQQKYAPQQGGY